MSERGPKPGIIESLAKLAGISQDTARKLGRNAVANQLLEFQGMDHATRCDDCQQSDQNVNDALKDLGID